MVKCKKMNKMLMIYNVKKFFPIYVCLEKNVFYINSMYH